MRLWPFPKKSETESLSTSCDLPEGVVLALPDEAAPASPTTPSYANPDNTQPVTDPAAGLEQEPSPLFSTPAQPSEPNFTEDFQQLIAPDKTGMPFTQTDPTEQVPTPPVALQPITPIEESPLQVEPEVDPSMQVEQCEVLEELLAQLNHTTPPPSPKKLGVANLGSLTDAQFALDAGSDHQAALEEWGLSPMETPALSNDWSLMPPAAATNSSGNNPYPEPAQAFLSVDPLELGNDGHSSQPMASLSDCFAISETQQAPLELAEEKTVETCSLPADTRSSEKFQAEFSLLDNLEPDALGCVSFGLENLGMAPMSSLMASTDFSNMSLEPPAWEDPETSVASSELAPFSDNQQHQAFSVKEELSEDQWMAPEPLSRDLPDSPLRFEAGANTMEEMSPLYEAYDPEDPENAWCSADDVISESAELNSSSSAYDLNHYDDPDEPSQTIDLDQDTSEFFTQDALQSLNSLLSPQSAGADSAAPSDPSFPVQANHEEDFNREAFLTGCNPIYHQEKLGMTHFGLETVEEHPITSLSEFAGPEPEMIEAVTPEDFYHYPGDAPVVMEPMDSLMEEPPSESYPDEPVYETYMPEPSIKASSLTPMNDKPLPPKPSILETLSAKWNSHTSPTIAQTDPTSPYSAQNQDFRQPVDSKQPVYNSDSVQPIRELPDPPSISMAGVKPPSLSQAMSNFEEEMLLQETRFIRKSINNLVERYFALQEPDSSI